MKKKSFTLIAAVLLMSAGVQKMWAQPGMVVMQDDKNIVIPISKVNQVLFVDDISEYANEVYVDLGLPSGTLWATCNIGAENPEDFGNYYAWGETETKSDYSWGTYIHCSGTNDTMIKYCTYGAYGTVDGITSLQPDDDAATANCGEGWYIPSNAQFEELLNSSYTTQEWTQEGGKDGWKITSISNGKSIFLPAAGRYEGTSCSSQGEMGYYWSSTLGSAGAYSSCDILFYSGGIYTGSADRRYGMTIRPVRDKYQAVDLGLPSGTLWATCNVGASRPEDYGDYFAWGETEPKDDYSWGTYKYCEGTEKTLTKYCSSSMYGYNGFTDNIIELQPEDDAAIANWGDNWQTPSSHQFRELINSNYTTAEWTTENGVNGYKITSISNGNSIFLPAAGWYVGTNLIKAGSDFTYWSSLLTVGNAWTPAYRLWNYSDQISVTYGERNLGGTIRPVRKQ